MTEVTRPIRVEISGLTSLFGTPQFFWWCVACDRNPDAVEGNGWQPSEAAAGDAGRAHLKVCPTVVAALDRLLADVMALPEYRRVWVMDPCGHRAEVTFCLDCGGVAILDEIEHTVTHLEANDRARGVTRDA